MDSGTLTAVWGSLSTACLWILVPRSCMPYELSSMTPPSQIQTLLLPVPFVMVSSHDQSPVGKQVWGEDASYGKMRESIWRRS